MPRPRAFTDDQLLETAMQLFWRHGYAGTGIRELEQGLGLKAPSLYHRFGSKEALFQAALARYIDRIVGTRVRRFLQVDPPLAGVRAFFDTTYNYVDPQHPALACLLVNTTLELGDSAPNITPLLVAGAQRVRDGFRDALLRARARAELAADVDIDAWVDTLHLALQGVLISSKAVSDPQRMRTQVDALFRLLPTTTSLGERAFTGAALSTSPAAESHENLRPIPTTPSDQETPDASTAHSG